MAQGPIRETGHKLDIALSGNGFLSVQTNQGTLYTQGRKSDGEQREATGYPGRLAGTGQKLADHRYENPAKFAYHEDGQIFDGDNQVGQPGYCSISARRSLKKAQNGYFEPQTAGTQPVKATNCTVRQGALEGANFNPVEEMARMVQTMRNFETYQKTYSEFARTWTLSSFRRRTG